MKAELKQKWIERLRSGQIAQAKNVLRDESNAMCCLGVLLDIEYPDGWSSEPTEEGGYAHTCGTPDNGFIDYRVRERLGLSEALSYEAVKHGEPMRLATAHYLAHMNDSGKTFSEIADWIEANVSAES